MQDSTQAVEQVTEAEVIREVCHQHKAQPEVIWDVLDEKGIETTPGMIYQAFNQAEQPTPKADSDGAPGLTPEELAVVSALAAKAGGVAEMVRSLQAWQEAPK